MSERNPQGNRFEDPFDPGPAELPIPESGTTAQRQREAFGASIEENDPFVDELDPRRDVEIDSQGGISLRQTAQAEIEDSAQEAVASENEFVEPNDISASAGPTGISDVGITTQGQRNRTSRRFESETALDDVDPTDDLRSTDDGFGLAREPARELAAEQLDDEIGAVDVTPGDIELEETDSGAFEASFEAEVRR